MKVVMKTGPQPGIEMRDIPVPGFAPDEVLIRVRAAGICGSDIHMYEWTAGYELVVPYMPLVLGHEFSGEVVEVGARITDFHVGDRVTAEPGRKCGRCRYCITACPYEARVFNWKRPVKGPCAGPSTNSNPEA